MRNAFFSARRERLEKTNLERDDGLEAHLLAKHFSGVILCDDTFGDDTDAVFMEASFGVPPGGVYAAEFFLDSFNPCIQEWLEKRKGAIRASLP